VAFNFIPYGSDQAFLLPPDARDRLPPDHLSWAIIEAVGGLDLGAFLAGHRLDGQGRPAYHPRMMVALVLYCYCKGIRSSRAIQMACFDDVGCRVITGNLHVDHATLARFVRRHRQALTALFVQVLAVCAREGLVSVDVVAGDGTKVKANASKCASVTAEDLQMTTEELRRTLEAEVTTWWRQADLLDEPIAPDQRPASEGVADHTDLDERGGGPDQDGLPTLSLARRKRTADKLARAEQARAMLIARHGDTRGALTALQQARRRAADAAERLARASAEQQAKLERHHAGQRANADGGLGAAGRPPKPMNQARAVPTARAEDERARQALVRALADPNKGNTPKGNITDPHCRIMPAKTGGYMCAYNLQALANPGQILLAITLHDNPVDVAARRPLLQAGRANLDAAGISEPIGTALFDAGYAGEDNFTAPCQADLLVAVHHESATCGRTHTGDKTIPAAWEQMAAKMSTPEALAVYKKRQAIIEPVFGQLFARLGRTLNYRGQMVHTELHLWATTHNLLKCLRNRGKRTPALHTAATATT
jgi:transposase